MIVMLVNIFTVDYFFIIPGVINIVLIIGIFFFSKDTIIKCKQLDLRMKTPVFEMVNEVVSGLVPIKVFKRRYSFLKKFSKLVNNMFRGTLSYWLTITAYSTYISYVTALLLMIWFLLGLYNI